MSVRHEGAILTALVDRFCRVGLAPYVTISEARNLLYFMRASGEGGKLPSAGSKGPIENDASALLPDDNHDDIRIARDHFKMAAAALEDSPQAHRCYERVCSLIEGFESDYGLDLLAKTYWVLKNNVPETPESLVAETRRWNERFSPRQVKLAAERLTMQGWAPRTH